MSAQVVMPLRICLLLVHTVVRSSSGSGSILVSWACELSPFHPFGVVESSGRWACKHVWQHGTFPAPSTEQRKVNKRCQTKQQSTNKGLEVTTATSVQNVEPLHDTSSILQCNAFVTQRKRIPNTMNLVHHDASPTYHSKINQLLRVSHRCG